MTPRELMQHVRQFCAENYPGCPLEYIAIHCRYLAAPIQLDEGPGAALPAALVSENAVEDERSDDRSNGVHTCVTEILKTLKQVGRPLTTTVLKQQMAKRGFTWNERTIKRYLADLMADGTIDNPKGAHPPGYRITCPDLVEGES